MKPLRSPTFSAPPGRIVRRKMIREFRQWCATRDMVAQFVEENLAMTGAASAAWSDLTEPTEREVWEKRKRKFPGD